MAHDVAAGAKRARGGGGVMAHDVAAGASVREVGAA